MKTEESKSKITGLYANKINLPLKQEEIQQQLSVEDSFTPAFPSDDPYTQHVADTLKKQSEKEFAKAEKVKEEGSASVKTGLLHQDTGSKKIKEADDSFSTATTGKEQADYLHADRAKETKKAICQSKKGQKKQDTARKILQNSFGQEQILELGIEVNLEKLKEKIEQLKIGDMIEHSGVSNLELARQVGIGEAKTKGEGLSDITASGIKKSFAANEFSDSKIFISEADDSNLDAAAKLEKANKLRLLAAGEGALSGEMKNLADKLNLIASSLEKQAHCQFHISCAKDHQGYHLFTRGQAIQASGQLTYGQGVFLQMMGNFWHGGLLQAFSMDDIQKGFAMAGEGERRHFEAEYDRGFSYFNLERAKNLRQKSCQLTREASLHDIASQRASASSDLLKGYASKDIARSLRFSVTAIDKTMAGMCMLFDAIGQEETGQQKLKTAENLGVIAHSFKDFSGKNLSTGHKAETDALDGILTETEGVQLSNSQQQQLKTIENNAFELMEKGSLQSKTAMARQLDSLAGIILAKDTSDAEAGKQIDALLAKIDGVTILGLGQKEEELGNLKLTESADANYNGTLAKGLADILHDKAGNSGL